jgi:hypothetical protein
MSRACRMTVGQKRALALPRKDDRPIVAVARHVDAEARLRPVVGRLEIVRAIAACTSSGPSSEFSDDGGNFPRMYDMTHGLSRP